MIVLSPLLMATLLCKIRFLKGSLVSDVSLMAFIISNPSTVCPSTDSPLTIHDQSGHPSLLKLQRLVPKLSGLHCESCQLGKHTHSHLPNRVDKQALSPLL